MDKKLIDVVVPHDQLKNDRMQAIQNFNTQKKREKVKTVFITIVFSIATLFFTLLTLSGTAPSVSSFISKIPGFKPIVSLMEEDKGLQDIIENEYFQRIDGSLKVNGIDVKLLGVIADEYNMIIAFEALSEDGEKIRPNDFTVLQNGEVMQVKQSYGWDFGEDELIQDIIRISSDKPIAYEISKFELVLNVWDDLVTSVRLPFTVKENILKTKKIIINEYMSFEGQRILVKSIRVSPIRTEIIFEVDESNDFQILQLGYIELIDETGETWGKIQNGLTAEGSPRDGEFSYFLQSYYFRYPETLTLKIGDVHALPKGKDSFIVDVPNERIANAEHLDVWNISIRNNALLIQQKNKSSITTSELVSEFIDAKGQPFYSGSTAFSLTEEDNETVITVPQDEMIQYPLTAVIRTYPNIIGDEQQLSIPIQND